MKNSEYCYLKLKKILKKKNKNIEKDENIFLSFLKAYFCLFGQMKHYSRGNEVL